MDNFLKDRLSRNSPDCENQCEKAHEKDNFHFVSNLENNKINPWHIPSNPVHTCIQIFVYFANNF